MDLGPLTGIRSVSLINARKPQKEDLPRFEIDATAHTGDESFTPSQDPPEHKDEEKPEQAVQAVADDDHATASPEPGHNWFV